MELKGFFFNKRFFLFFFLFLLSCTLIHLDAEKSPGKETIEQLTILHTNDLHGHPLKFENYPIPDVGGLPAISTLVHKIRKETKNLLVLDAGDINIGRPESNFFKGETDIIGMNHIGYDAMTLGNHEFSISLVHLNKLKSLATFPFLSANIVKLNGEYLAQPYIIKKFGTFSVGIFGLTTTETSSIGVKSNLVDLKIEDELKTAEKIVAILKTKTDIIIALTHLGIFGDNFRGSKLLASEIKGIDLIIDGHSHTKLSKPIVINNTPIVQAWKWGMNVGRADFIITDRKVTGFNWQPIPINLKTMETTVGGKKIFTDIGEPIKEDIELLEKLSPYMHKISKIFSEEIGYAQESFCNQHSRFKESPLGNLVADAMLWITKEYNPDFALQNSGGIRCDLPAGKITKKNINETLPFENTIAVITISGKDLKEVFDFVCSIPPGEGGFAQFSEGIRLTIDVASKTCTDIKIKGKEIEENRDYRVTVTSYLAGGGNGYKVLLKAKESNDTLIYHYEALSRYISSLKEKLQPVMQDRIMIKNFSGVLPDQSTVH